MKNSFVLFTEIRDVVEQLTNEQKGLLFQAILDYEGGNDPDLSEQAVRVAFIPIKQNLDRCDEKWELERQSRSEAGKKGMESRWGKKKSITNDNTVITNDNTVISVITNDNKALQDITKITDNVNVNVNVNDKDINNINVSINYQKVVDLYNTICKSLPQVKRLTDSRKRAIKARLKTYSMEDFEKAFRMAEESSFLKGETQNWSANFDWLMNDNNLAKVLDGNYKNKTSKIEMDGKLREFINKNQVVDFGM